jgi:hypothetical protein
MWRTITFALVFASVICMIATEILRSIAHKRREEQDGLGGTQDIAMWGTLLGMVLLLGSCVSGLLWLFAG